MGKGKPPNKYRSTKRKFQGNRFQKNIVSPATNPDNPEVEEGLSESVNLGDLSCSGASAKKLKLSLESDASSDPSCYILILSGILKDMFEKFAKCQRCNGGLSLELDNKFKAGLACKICVLCQSCGDEEAFYTSKRVKKIDPASKTRKELFDINIRSVMAFREIGRGYLSMQKFAGVMNLGKIMVRKHYNAINERVHESYHAVAQECCKAAAQETWERCESMDDKGIKDCQVSVDGTWQKRGHASLNGVVTLISKENGKCIDYAVLSKKCKGCEHWRSRKDHPKFNSWLANHDCKINHKGSAGSMEGKGAVMMFCRSVEKNSLRYTAYIGDGDTSSFGEVVDAKPYGEDVIIEKKECVGHVQKRMGCRLRFLKQSMKGQRLADGKKLTGKGRLTDKAINTIQNYYGMAIRQNCNNMYAMKKSVIAILHHCTAIPDEQKRHMYCPRAETSWCKWWQDKLKETNTFKSNINLPPAVKGQLEPIFRDLSADSLLSKCLHGQTQNDNESLNSMIWKKCPKSVFVCITVLEIAVSSAVIEFNNGCSGILDVMKHLGMEISKHVQNGLGEIDKDRVKKSAKDCSESARKRRKKLRSLRKGYQDREKELEGGNSYFTGSF